MMPVDSTETDLAPPLSLLDSALDAYTYAYPLIAMDTVRRMDTSVLKADTEHGRGAPINQFTHLRRVPDTASSEPRPSLDTLRSSLWFDVSAEPLIITLPDADDRFFTLSLLDAWGDAFACLGGRSTGTRAQRFAIVGPGWRRALPRGIRVYRSPTARGWAVGMTELRGPDDVPRVARFQASLSAAPWSRWGQLYAPPSGAAELLPVARDTARAVSLMRTEQYFTRFCELTRHDPPHAHDHAVLDRMRRIGLIPGRPLRYSALPPSVRSALEQAALIAPIRLEAAYGRLRDRVNHWHRIGKPYAAHGSDYTTRAAVAFGGARASEDVVTFCAGQDAAGDAFDSSRRYTLRFGRGQQPPAQAFWSLTLYDDRRGLAENELGRHAVGSRDELVADPDGAVTLLIQRERPSSGSLANWLPAPRAGGFSLSLRAYWPTAAVRDGVWAPPPPRRADERGSALSRRPALLRLERPGA